MPIFRREFEIEKRLRAAVVSISGLGQYELLVNGKPVTPSLLNPGWTDYRKTALHQSWEVADLLRPGANVLGVRLGNGMYNVEGVKGRYTKFIGSFGQPKLIAQLRLLFEDGSEAFVATDAAWTARPGPITFSSTYGGEDFDARLEPKGWTEPGAPTDGWTPAREVEGPGGRLKAKAFRRSWSTAPSSRSRSPSPRRASSSTTSARTSPGCRGSGSAARRARPSS